MYVLFVRCLLVHFVLFIVAYAQFKGMAQGLIQHQKAVDETLPKSHATMRQFASCDEEAFAMNNQCTWQWLLIRVEQFKIFASQGF